MSKWNDSFNSQQVLQRIKESLRVIEASSTESLPADELNNYARLLKVLKVLEARFESIDPELYPLNIWSNMGTWTTTLQSHATTFSQNKNVGSLQNANGVIEEILTALKPIDINAKDHVKATVEAGKEFQKKIINELETTRKAAETIKAELNSLSKSISQGNAKLDEHTQTIEQQKGRLDQAIASYQKQFSETEANRTKQFAAETKRYTDDFQALKKSVDDQLKNTRDEQTTQFKQFTDGLKKKGDEHLAFLKKREEEVNQIFEAIGTASFAGHFARTADQERKTANWLRGGALFLMGAMVIVAGATFYHSLRHDITWQIFLFRLSTSIIILIPGIYAAQESAKHREREKQARKMHMELASIDAYLVLLPETQRNEIKAKLTEKFFGREEAVDKEEPVTRHMLFELLSSVIKGLVKK